MKMSSENRSEQTRPQVNEAFHLKRDRVPLELPVLLLVIVCQSKRLVKT
jgi:hypothetical protein